MDKLNPFAGKKIMIAGGTSGIGLSVDGGALLV